MTFHFSTNSLAYYLFYTFVLGVFLKNTGIISPAFMQVLDIYLYTSILLIPLINFSLLYSFKRWALPTFLFLFLYTLFYIIKSIYHGEQIVTNILVRGVYYFLAYYIIATGLENWGFNRTLNPFIFSSSLVLILSIIKYLGVDIPLYSIDNSLKESSIEYDNVVLFKGVFFNQNSFALLLLIHIISTLLYISFSKPYSVLIKNGLYLLFVFSLYFLLFTMSRSAILGGFVIIFLYQLKKMQTKKGLSLLVLSFILILIGFYFLNDYIEAIRNRTLVGGTSGRTEIWADAFSKLKSNMLFGVGNYSYEGFGGVALSAHNFYIQKLVSDGLLVFFLLLLFIIVTLKKAINLYLIPNTSILRSNYWVLTSSFIAILLHQFFEASLLTPFIPLTLLFFFLTANINKLQYVESRYKKYR